MAASIKTLLKTPSGHASETVARFMWQLDEQRRTLIEDTRGLTRDDLEWQPAPGMNTIGMLLAHIAYAECHLAQVGLEAKATSDVRAVIGISDEDEGLPLAAGAPPSPALAGRELGWFDGLLERARDHTRRVALTLTEPDLAREIVRPRPDGTQRVFNPGWVLYHMLEHEAGHHAQINLLKHLRRTRSD